MQGKEKYKNQLIDRTTDHEHIKTFIFYNICSHTGIDHFYAGKCDGKDRRDLEHNNAEYEGMIMRSQIGSSEGK